MSSGDMRSSKKVLLEVVEDRVENEGIHETGASEANPESEKSEQNQESKEKQETQQSNINQEKQLNQQDEKGKQFTHSNERLHDSSKEAHQDHSIKQNSIPAFSPASSQGSSPPFSLKEIKNLQDSDSEISSEHRFTNTQDSNVEQSNIEQLNPHEIKHETNPIYQMNPQESNLNNKLRKNLSISPEIENEIPETILKDMQSYSLYPSSALDYVLQQVRNIKETSVLLTESCRIYFIPWGKVSSTERIRIGTLVARKLARQHYVFQSIINKHGSFNYFGALARYLEMRKVPAQLKWPVREISNSKSSIYSVVVHAMKTYDKSTSPFPKPSTLIQWRHYSADIPYTKDDLTKAEIKVAIHIRVIYGMEALKKCNEGVEKVDLGS